MEGSQLVLHRISLAKSAQASDMTQNSLGQGEPPKVSRRLIREKSPMLMMHFTAVSP